MQIGAVLHTDVLVYGGDDPPELALHRLGRNHLKRADMMIRSGSLTDGGGG